MQITMVKKIKADGTPCRKCNEVEQRLTEAGLLQRIDNIVIADERDADSPGMQLASRYGVERAPFFIVEQADREPAVYTVYMQFLKDVLNHEVSATDAARDIMDANPDIDYI